MLDSRITKEVFLIWFHQGKSITLFYEDLLKGDKRLLNSATRGFFVDLTNDVAKQLSAKTTANELQIWEQCKVEIYYWG